jgi:hypothetical protein
MIRYQLACANDHHFESWFRDSSSFDTQVDAGLLSCPACGTDRVAKSIMAPAVVGAAGRREIVAREQPGARGPVALLDDRQQALRAALRELRSKILAQGEDVGSRFPEQARQMHDGEIPTRPIHGQATPQEARGLLEDGIPILPIPVLPEELN